MTKSLDPFLAEAKRLFDIGFAVHWIRPNSKAPVKSGWTTGPRDTWETLEREYQKGFGLGVRLGDATEFKDGTYLANLDIDVKSADVIHRAEAMDAVERLFPGLAGHAAAVKTGYGLRLFFRTKKPVPSRRLAGSGTRVRVKMPTSPISAEQKKSGLTEEELKAGWRIRPAWEIELMSAGKQVVLPPSIHPDTGKGYAWAKPITQLKDMPAVLSDVLGAIPAASKSKQDSAPKPGHDFQPVDLDYMDDRFTPYLTRLIFGDGVNDRSAACFSATIAMLKGGFSDDEILSVLTDRDTFLGETAFEHRKTTSRANAAAWAWDYCIRKAKVEADAARAFANVAIVESNTLSKEEAAEQRKGIVSAVPWQSRIKRSGKDGDGGIKPTLDNTLLILRNVVSPGLFRRDLFAMREMYGVKPPWISGGIGKSIEDRDAIAIKAWLAERFGFEPTVGTIFEAITRIADDNEFHPVQAELRELPAWDLIPRIDTWLAKHFGAQGSPEYLAQVFRKWLVAAVTRTFEPGAKFDWMPIFEGAQGTGKSSFGAILFGQNYFSDWLPNLADKDAAIGLAGRRCVEFGELATMRRSEIDTVKAFITRQIDIVRPPYGRKNVEIHRGCVFFGTTNREHYLQDDTGNRRFNPVRVGWLDFAALARDRDQLWAEALFIYELGLEGSLYLEGSAVGDAVALQKSKQVKDESDLMAELIEDFVNMQWGKPDNERFSFERFQVRQLFEGMGPLGAYKLEMKNIKHAAKALYSLGAAHWKSDGNKVWRLNTVTITGS